MLVLWAVLLAIPIVPFVILGEDALSRFFPDASESGRGAGAGACFLLLVLDVFLPVPSSLVAILSGRILGPAGGFVLNWVGITLGHVVGFGLARRGGRPLAIRLLGEDGLARAGTEWGRGSTASLVLSRPLPVLAEAVAMYAGLSTIPLRRFALVVSIANLPHAAIYAFAGAGSVEAGGALWVSLAALGVPTAAWLAFQARRRGRDSPTA